MVNNNTSNQSEQVQLNLLENAFNSLLSAAEAVQRDEGSRGLKDAVLHLGNGIELLVKARLARENWSLIFSNTNQASYQKLADAEFTSVNFPKAITRLERNVGVTIDKPIISDIKNLRKLRNQLTHFTATLDSVQAKSLVAKAMAFCIEFCEQQGMITPDTEAKLGLIHRNLATLTEFVNERSEANWEEEWEDRLIWDCPACWQLTLVIDDGATDCKYCKRKFEPREVAEINAIVQPVDDCLECGAESTVAFAKTILDRNFPDWICFSCGVIYGHCFECYGYDQLTPIDDSSDILYCEKCLPDRPATSSES